MVRFGLIGCGKIAERHANILTAGDLQGACLGAYLTLIKLIAKSLQLA